MRSPLHHLCLLVTAAFVGVASPASAVLLDWDGVSWTAGSLSNSYDIDPANAGNDVTVTIAGNGGPAFQQELTGSRPMTPAIAASFQGGLPTIENTLCIALNLTSNTQSVTFDLAFSANYTAGVSNVSFKLFDIDYSSASGNTYQDLVNNIHALSIDGTTLIAPTITTSSSNSLSGTGLNQSVLGTVSTVDTGAGSGNGNVTISFGNNAIKSLTFTYGSGTAFADPTYQHIGIHDISFTPVPEVNPALISFLSCLLAAAFVVRHRSICRRK